MYPHCIQNMFANLCIVLVMFRIPTCMDTQTYWIEGRLINLLDGPRLIPILFLRQLIQLSAMK